MDFSYQVDTVAKQLNCEIVHGTGGIYSIWRDKIYAGIVSYRERTKDIYIPVSSRERLEFMETFGNELSKLTNLGVTYQKVF